MKDRLLLELVERLCGLIHADNRRATADVGLQPVHLDVLRYLARCNHYSNTPAAVTQFLNSTKGTVSQSINVLQREGLIAKLADADDKRVVRLRLTKNGRHLVQRVSDATALQRAVARIDRADRKRIEASLVQLLRSAQEINDNRTFGQCLSCRHLRKSSGGKHQCGLTGEKLTVADTKLICLEHEYPDSAA